MAADTFAKIGDIQGESNDARHKGEIDVQSWSWGVSQAATVAGPGGGGAATGKPTFQDFQFTHAVDKATPNLLKACATGQHIPDAIITIRKAGAGQQEFLTITMSDVIVTGVHPAAPAGATALSETVALQFGKVDLEYKPQKPDGSLDAGIHFVYDVRTNRAG
jgi:type VI secretion system secreted protein Hcp